MDAVHDLAVEIATDHPGRTLIVVASGALGLTPCEFGRLKAAVATLDPSIRLVYAVAPAAVVTT